MSTTPDVSYTPCAVNARAKGAVGMLSASAALGFGLSFLLGEYGGIIQLCALAAIVYALYIASRFLFVSYTYSLFKNEKGTTYFLIEEKQGKRTSLVCQLPLERIYAVKPFPEAKGEAGGRYYTYVATMSGGEYQVVLARGETGKAGIKIEADAAFLAAFQKALSEEKPQTDEE